MSETSNEKKSKKPVKTEQEKMNEKIEAKNSAPVESAAPVEIEQEKVANVTEQPFPNPNHVEGFEAAPGADDFENIDMGNFEIFKFSENKKGILGATFTGKFVGVRDGELPENKGINGLNFTDVTGKKRFVISAYFQLNRYFSALTEADKAAYIYRIRLDQIKEGAGQSGSDVFVFDVARKLDSNQTTFANSKTL